MQTYVWKTFYQPFEPFSHLPNRPRNRITKEKQNGKGSAGYGRWRNFEWINPEGFLRTPRMRKTGTESNDLERDYPEP
ncbi:hypothetical protein RUM44_008244 [Polyplax serrata]|uniref:Uncharacterized protein n=1 Tax=Polyplax serrata TaxID=468196 RepID=A0ABR1BBS0_POLSC